MNIDVNTLAIIIGMFVNVIAVAGIVTRSNVRLENRLTKMETSVAFVLQMMKVNLGSTHTRDED